MRDRADRAQRPHGPVARTDGPRRNRECFDRAATRSPERRWRPPTNAHPIRRREIERGWEARRSRGRAAQDRCSKRERGRRASAFLQLVGATTLHAQSTLRNGLCRAWGTPHQKRVRLKAGPAYADHDLIFTNASGGPLDYKVIARRRSRPLARALGMPNLTVYGLRHSHATVLLAAGGHPRLVADRLGHSTPTLTLATYSHVQAPVREEIASQVDALLFRTQRRRRESSATVGVAGFLADPAICFPSSADPPPVSFRGEGCPRFSSTCENNLARFAFLTTASRTRRSAPRHEAAVCSRRTRARTSWSVTATSYGTFSAVPKLWAAQWTFWRSASRSSVRSRVCFVSATR